MAVSSTASVNSIGYGPRRALALFNGDETKYELWEVKFLAHMRLQKFYEVFVPGENEPTTTKIADAFAELVQCLDDRSLSLREARDDGPRALEVLRQHYKGKGNTRVIALHTELTTLKKGDGESTVDYVIRAETAATALREADEVISDALLVPMVLKGLPNNFKTFSAIVVQRDKEMTFSEFKTQLRSYEESEKSRNEKNEDNVMTTKINEKFGGSCFKCGKKGHKKSECWSKTKAGGKSGKWCNHCKTKSHETKECRANSNKNESAKKAEDQKEKSSEKNDEHAFAFRVSDSSGKSINSNLLVDSGATSHIINDKSKFVTFDSNSNSHVIELADGSKANVVTGRGEAKVKLFDINGSLHDIILHNALYFPTYQQDIFSVNAAVKKAAVA